MTINEWQEIDNGIYWMKKHRKTKKIKFMEERKKQNIIATFIIIFVIVIFALLIIFGGKATMNLG